MVATFQEDVDLTSADLPGVQINGENLKLWAEHQIWMKWGSRDSNGVYLGWDNSIDKEKVSYTLTLTDEAIKCTADTSLVFSMADTGEDPPVDDSEETPDKSDKESEIDPPEEPERKSIDCSVVVTDENGAEAVLRVAHGAESNA